MGRRGVVLSERPNWDFEYAPISIGARDDGASDCELILATADDIDPARVAEALSAVVANIEVTPLFTSHPIFWTRIHASAPLDRYELENALRSSGVDVRYLVSAKRGSQALAPRLPTTTARRRKAGDWKDRRPSAGAEPFAPWRWFLRAEGVNVSRAVCGTGAGTRLAVIDNDGYQLEQIDLDAKVLVGVESVPNAGAHAGLMFGWAVGARLNEGGHFRGVAPDASPRLYCIPKAGDEIVSLPLAIVRAVEDGADVVVCATYVEGLTSPLLDDALEFATCLGRGGRGTVVVMPTGREMSSPAGSVHSSLSLGLGDPASDPRVFCVGPSARNGGWFLWRDRHGKMRPFANRGPALRWLAPGDDLAYPFSANDRPAHAESSGASAVAAGVLLLILGCNPTLDLGDLDQLLLNTIVGVQPDDGDPVDVGDAADLLPVGRDPDGHNAKHGYGRLSALTACLSSCDPVAATLVRIGDVGAAYGYSRANQSFYSPAFARWAARVLLRDPLVRHGACALARAVRLYSQSPERSTNQEPGHIFRQLALVLRLMARASPPAEVARELVQLEEKLRKVLTNHREVHAVEAEFIAFSSQLNDVASDGASVADKDVGRHPSGVRNRLTDGSIVEQERASR